MANGHAYCAIELDDLRPERAEALLAHRPTLGVGLGKRHGRQCALGNLDGTRTELLAAARDRRLPPRGSRVVLARSDVTSVLVAAWLELRADGLPPAAKGRFASFSRALRYTGDLCKRLRGVDPSGMADDDETLLRALVCTLGHHGGIPLRRRVDLAAEYFATGAFAEQRSATPRLRGWLAAAMPTPTPPQLRPVAQAEPAATRTAAEAGNDVVADPAPPVPPVPREKGLAPPQPGVTPGTSEDLRDAVAAQANLHAAWERVRDNSRAKGAPSKALARFESEVTTNLGSIRSALLDGSWRPSPLTHVQVPKKDARVRHLHVPTVADRVVERAIAQVLGRIVDPRLSPWSFAFRPGRGVVDAIRELARLRDEGATHVARFDLANCFDSVSRARLKGAFAAHVTDDWLRHLAAMLIDRPLPGLPDGASLIGIAQGSPLSPLLANVLLDDLDAELVSAGFPAVRYADDLALAADSADAAECGLRVATEAAGRLGFRVRVATPAVTAFEDVVEFLGERVGPCGPASDNGADSPPPRQRTLYLTSRAAHVRLRAGQVQAFTRDRQRLLSVPVSGLGRVVVMGPASVSPGLRSYALGHGLEVAFLSRSGSWLGRYDPGLRVDPRLRRRQYAIEDDEAEAMPISRAIVDGKLRNQRALLLRYARGSGKGSGDDAAQALADLADRLGAAGSRAEVMGIEGAAAKRFYQAFAGLLPSWAGFRGRTKRPPRDKANAALSFGYTLLTGEAHAACACAGTDPQVGVLHATAKRRPALALDLMEEFRPLIVDSLVVGLFRRRRLRDEHFRDGKDGAVLLNDAGRKAFIEGYESRMLSRFHSPAAGARITYREALRQQAQVLADAIRDPGSPYVPVHWR